MLMNHNWAYIIEINVKKWSNESLRKFEIQMSRHEKQYRSEEIAPADKIQCPTIGGHSINTNKLKGDEEVFSSL